MGKEFVLLSTSFVVIILFASFVVAATLNVHDPKFVYPTGSDGKVKTKYSTTDSVSVIIKATITGGKSVKNDIIYVGLEWGTDKVVVGFKKLRCGETTKTTGDITCVKQFDLEGTADDYKSYTFAAATFGWLDGKRMIKWVYSDKFPILIESVSKAEVPTNEKPTVKVEVNKEEVFVGESVKVTIHATSDEPDLKSVTLNVPSLSKSEPKPCGDTEKRSCKKTFDLNPPDAGTVGIEAVAEDVFGLTSEKASKSITVKPRVAVVKGLNLFIVTSQLVGNNLINKDVFGGIFQCRSPEVRVLSKPGDDYKYDTVGLDYKVDKKDILIVIYCATQETVSDPFYSDPF